MHDAGYLLEVIVILLAAVIAVSATLRFKLGSVLGYLIAGVAIGPSSLGLIHNLDTIRALAEFGVTHINMPATPETVWRAIHQR